MNYNAEPTIKLYACKTGAKQDGFANGLAKGMSVTVIAPTTNVILTYTRGFRGYYTKVETSLKGNGEWKSFTP